MSKITQALEKAARERLHRQERPTAPAVGVTVPAVASEIVDIASVNQLEVDPHIVSLTDARSPVAEQYRILKTNLQSLRLGHSRKALVITSALHSEGKSVTALNLALTLARQEQLRVVLVDADLRKSDIHRWLGIAAPARGLSTCLAQDGALDGSLVRLQSPSLAILPSGPVPEDPVGLLESVNLKRLLATLKAQFDLVLLDCPPVLSVADPGIVAAVADGTILVVRAGRTQRRTILNALTRLRQMKAEIFGCVLTHMESYLPGHYSSYYYQGQTKRARKSDDATPLPLAPA